MTTSSATLPDPLCQTRADLLPHLFATSGSLLRAAYRSGGIRTETKEALSPLVTDVDRSVERALVSLIRATFPDDAILGEEDGAFEGASPYRWIIDPIDGTSSFVRGLPLFGTLIGCVDQRSGTIVFGGADQPILGDQFIAMRGVPPQRNGEPLINRYRDDTSTPLSEACLCATTPQMFTTPDEKRVMDAVTARCRRTAWGGDWFNYALMVSSISAIPLVIVEAGLNYYDICALVPLIEGVGGKITDWTGSPVASSTTQVVAAPSLHLWQQLMETIHRSETER